MTIRTAHRSVVVFKKEEMQMNSDAHDCCCCAGKMREGRHDFMARVVDEIIVIKDIPALICDTCGEVEYTLEVSKDAQAYLDIALNDTGVL